METQTEHSNDKITLWQQETQPELQLWAIDQLTLLAIALCEPMTPERLNIYAKDLAADLTREQLQLAFIRARRECKFFPKIAELREMAGGKVEAEAAWQFVNRYLQRYGVVVYDRDNRPPLHPRIDYALRRIGGLNGLNQITEESRPFMFRDFCDAYQQAPIADLMQPRLSEMFGKKQLSGTPQPKQLLEAVQAQQRHTEQTATSLRPCRSRKFPNHSQMQNCVTGERY